MSQVSTSATSTLPLTVVCMSPSLITTSVTAPSVDGDQMYSDLQPPSLVLMQSAAGVGNIIGAQQLGTPPSMGLQDQLSPASQSTYYTMLCVLHN